MRKGISRWVCLALMASGVAGAADPAGAPLHQVNYTESVQPTVRISGASLAGLSLLPPGGVMSGDRAFWVKLPKDFNGALNVELTRHDYRFQATVNFAGSSAGGWQKLNVETPKGMASKLGELNLGAPTTALRAWIAGDEKVSRKYVLIRWGEATGASAFSADRLRVQLNLGTAPEAAAWLRMGKELKAGDCQPADKNSRSNVYFQWVCEFDGVLTPVQNSASAAKLIVKRRERDGRESDDIIEPQW